MEGAVYARIDVDKEKLALSVLHGYEVQPRLDRIVTNRADLGSPRKSRQAFDLTCTTCRGSNYE